MQRWFLEHAKKGWATCPIVENGVVRVVSQAEYPSGQRRPEEIVNTLQNLKVVARESHQFWPDDISLSDATLFRAEFILASRQVTDAYLLGLAAKRGGTLVSFDRSLPWQAIRGGTAGIIQTPA
jgi:predicted nucleic acid-binding protein